MSLIQISSNSRDLNNISQGANTFNTGARFNNYFNGSPLEIPPFSEVALHQGQFTIESSSELDFSVVGDGDGTGLPCIRTLGAKTANLYYDNCKQDFETNNSYPTWGTCQPLKYNVPRKRFNNVQQFWNKMADILYCDPRPQLQGTKDATGLLLTGFSVDVAGGSGSITTTGNYIYNSCDTTIKEYISEDVFKEGSGLIGTPYENQIVEQDGTSFPIGSYVTYTNVKKISGGTGVNTPAIWWTQSNGLHNSGGGWNCRQIVINAWNGPGTPFRPRQHMITLGIKKWGNRYYDVSPDYQGLPYNTLRATGAWSDMESCREWFEIKYQGLSDGDYSAFIGDTLKPYLFTSEVLFNPNFYNLQAEEVMDYFFVINGKILYNAANEPVGVDSQNLVVHICKYEVGLQSSQSDLLGKVICIATGCSNTSTIYGIPYSANLDPTSGADWCGGSFPDRPVGAVDGLGPNGGPVYEIDIEGNKVDFNVGGTQILIAFNEADFTAGRTEILLQTLADVVYPLQIAGSFRGDNDFIERLQQTIAVPEGQKEVVNYGDNYDNFWTYVAEQAIIPASIFNDELDRQTPVSFYPLDPSSPTPVPYNDITTERVVPFGLVQPKNIEREMWIGLGRANATDSIPTLLDGGQLPPVSNPGVDRNVGFPIPAVAPNLEGVWNLATGSPNYESCRGDYENILIVNPFLAGMFIHLDNLPNTSTFGGINQANTSKLISCINRYDQTNDDDLGTHSEPVYAYNEYERLYVALNNPQPLYMNNLSFHITDRHGNQYTTIRSTNLVLHIRKGADFYGGYKRDRF